MLVWLVLDMAVELQVASLVLHLCKSQAIVEKWQTWSADLDALLVSVLALAYTLFLLIYWEHSISFCCALAALETLFVQRARDNDSALVCDGYWSYFFQKSQEPPKIRPFWAWRPRGF